MHPSDLPDHRLQQFAEMLDIPDSSYEQAKARYESLGAWFHRPESIIAQYAPAVCAQGSFRLGTVVRPLLEGEEYDLDLVCELKKLAKHLLTQKQLKEMVGIEVKAYALAHNIKSPVVERKRCWRLDYADDISFHMDVLPSVHESEQVIAALVATGVETQLAPLAIALTCKSHPRYEIITADWPTSNPGGYAKWFESRMTLQADARRRQLVAQRVYATVEEVPTYALKTVLQRCIQLLKRHRDVMFQDDPDVKPISMILTTLAARAYGGQESLAQAMTAILRDMPEHVRSSKPRVENPVNPGEDFADKWAKDPNLEVNFWRWHAQATADFAALTTERDSMTLRKRTAERLRLELGESEAGRLTGATGAATIIVPAVRVTGAPRPWGPRV